MYTCKAVSKHLTKVGQYCDKYLQLETSQTFQDITWNEKVRECAQTKIEDKIQAYQDSGEPLDCD